MNISPSICICGCKASIDALTVKCPHCGLKATAETVDRAVKMWNDKCPKGRPTMVEAGGTELLEHYARLRDDGTLEILGMECIKNGVYFLHLKWL